MKELTVKDVCKMPEKMQDPCCQETIGNDFYACGYNSAIDEIGSLPVTMPLVPLDEKKIYEMSMYYCKFDDSGNEVFMFKKFAKDICAKFGSFKL
jgi:hypothetical protein